MSVKVNEAVRICKILTTGPIEILGRINGPITKCRLTNKQIIAIMRSGHKVAEYNPKNPKEWKILTLDNNGASPFENTIGKEIPENTLPVQQSSRLSVEKLPSQEESNSTVVLDVSNSVPEKTDVKDLETNAENVFDETEENELESDTCIDSDEENPADVDSGAFKENIHFNGNNKKNSKKNRNKK